MYIIENHLKSENNVECGGSCSLADLHQGLGYSYSKEAKLMPEFVICFPHKNKWCLSGAKVPMLISNISNHPNLFNNFQVITVRALLVTIVQATVRKKRKCKGERLCLLKTLKC
jgi:hypothetical protein